MSDINKKVGQRIKQFRLEQGLSQEKLGEMADLHYTYIGQVERGEKNATITSLEKITKALNISLSTLFEKIDEAKDSKGINYPLEFYEFISSKTTDEQERLFGIMTDICKYKT